MLRSFRSHNWHILESFRCVEAHDIMASYCCPHRLIVSDKRHFHFQQSRRKFTLMDLCQIGYGTDITVEFDNIVDFYTLSVPITGEQYLHQGDQCVNSTPSRGIIISPSQSVQLDMSSDCKKRLVRISREVLENALQKRLGSRLTRPIVFDCSMDLNEGAAGSWWRTVNFLEREQSIDGSLYQRQLFYQHIEQMLIDSLLMEQQHNYSEALKSRPQILVPAYVRRAERFIQENAHRLITKEDIVAASAVPARTLYFGFKRFRNNSPMRYLKEVRLENVRLDIINNGHKHKLTDIATHWWFTHLGRFSNAYKQRFGELPSKTLAGSKP